MRTESWLSTTSKTKEDPLDPETGTIMRTAAEAIRHVEDAVVKAGGA